MTSSRFGRSAMPRFICSAMALGLLAGSVHAAPPGVRHVRADAAGGGDGLSWATAYNDLREALITAGASGGTITELWVKEGTYLPAPEGSTDRTRSFTLVDGVGVYGGFAGVETGRDQRDPAARATTLSGFLGGTTRVHNVVIGAGNSQTVLDGFIITGGMAALTSMTGPGWAGAGIHITGSPTIRGCTITGNSAGPAVGLFVSLVRSGAGVYCAPGSAATLSDCIIASNSMERSTAFELPAGRGAGLAAESCTVNLSGCVISNNVTGRGSWFGCGGGRPSGGADGGDGGGLHFTDAAALIQNCHIVENTTGTTDSSPVCGSGIPCGIDSRHAGKGGGVFAVDSTILMMNTELSGNITGDGGPGASSYCTASGGNGGDGGGVYSAGSDVLLINCLLKGNRTGAGGAWAGSHFAADGGNGGDGAGVWAADGDVRLINCTIVGGLLGMGQPGTPADYGDPGTPPGTDGENGAGAAVFGAAVYLENCIAWNVGQTSEVVDAGAAYSDIRGGYTGIGNISADPLFIDPASGDHRLQSSSPCIDAGNSLVDIDPSTPGTQPIPSTDLDGLPRRVDVASVPDTGVGTPVVDMGAYEVQNPCPIDYTGDGVVDFADYLVFLNLYDAADPRADLNGDGLIDFSDYLEFLNLYESGC